jgi:hypothetical protein
MTNVSQILLTGKQNGRARHLSALRLAAESQRRRRLAAVVVAAVLDVPQRGKRFRARVLAC